MQKRARSASVDMGSGVQEDRGASSVCCGERGSGAPIVGAGAASGVVPLGSRAATAWWHPARVAFSVLVDGAADDLTSAVDAEWELAAERRVQSSAGCGGGPGPMAFGSGRLCSTPSPSEARARVQSGGAKPFACSLCEYRCSKKSYLVVHERVHRGKRPYACSQCEYRCSVKAHLVVHERVHSGERPYACSVCEYRCSQRAQLVTHERVHSGEKPYAC